MHVACTHVALPCICTFTPLCQREYLLPSMPLCQAGLTWCQYKVTATVGLGVQVLCTWFKSIAHGNTCPDTSAKLVLGDPSKQTQLIINIESMGGATTIAGAHAGGVTIPHHSHAVVPRSARRYGTLHLNRQGLEPEHFRALNCDNHCYSVIACRMHVYGPKVHNILDRASDQRTAAQRTAAALCALCVTDNGMTAGAACLWHTCVSTLRARVSAGQLHVLKPLSHACAAQLLFWLASSACWVTALVTRMCRFYCSTACRAHGTLLCHQKGTVNCTISCAHAYASDSACSTCMLSADARLLCQQTQLLPRWYRALSPLYAHPDLAPSLFGLATVATAVPVAA